MGKLADYFKSYVQALSLQGGGALKVADIFVRVLSVVIFPFIYIFLLLIEFFVKVRIGFLYNRRLGHLAFNTELFLRRKKLGLIDRGAKYIFFSFSPANKQLVKMFQRHITIINNEFLSKMFTPIGFFRTRFWQPLPFEGNEFYEFNNAKRTLYFTDEEERRGVEELNKIGIKEGGWYVCFFARDESYTKHMFSGIDHSSTDHRNSDIDSYIKAAKYIVEQGGHVIRMGYKVSKEFGYKHEKVIDYAVHHRTDFMDVYLAAHCRFFLGTSAGGSDMAHIFDTPFAGVNYVPIGCAPFGKNEISIPKNVYYKGTHEQVPFDKQMDVIGSIEIAFGVHPEDVLDKNGMVLIDNTPDQILEVAQEMLIRLQGDWAESEEFKVKLEQYNNILKEKKGPWSNYWHQIGEKFILDMKLN